MHQPIPCEHKSKDTSWQKKKLHLRVWRGEDIEMLGQPLIAVSVLFIFHLLREVISVSDCSQQSWHLVWDWMTTDVRDQLEGDACDGELAVEFIDIWVTGSHRMSQPLSREQRTYLYSLGLKSVPSPGLFPTFNIKKGKDTAWCSLWNEDRIWHWINKNVDPLKSISPSLWKWRE